MSTRFVQHDNKILFGKKPRKRSGMKGFLVYSLLSASNQHMRRRGILVMDIGLGLERQRGQEKEKKNRTFVVVSGIGDGLYIDTV